MTIEREDIKTVVERVRRYAELDDDSGEAMYVPFEDVRRLCDELSPPAPAPTLPDVRWSLAELTDDNTAIVAEWGENKGGIYQVWERRDDGKTWNVGTRHKAELRNIRPLHADAELRERVKELDSENAELADELAILADWIKSHHNGYDPEARAQMPTLKKPATLIDALESLFVERNELHESELDTLRAELKQERITSHNARATRDCWQRNLDKAEADRNAMRDDRDEWIDVAEQRAADLVQLSTERDTLQEGSRLDAGRILALRECIAELEQRNRRQTETFETFQRDRDAAEKRIAELQAERDDLKGIYDRAIDREEAAQEALEVAGIKMADKQGLLQSVADGIAELAARPDAGLLADVEAFLSRALTQVDGPGHSGYFTHRDELLSRVRAAQAEPVKPPMPRELVERLKDYIEKSTSPAIWYNQDTHARQLLADLAKVSDPQPGVTREQAEVALCHAVLRVPIVPFVLYDDGTRGIDLEWLEEAVKIILRELGTVEPVVTAR